ncbi:MAG TPA: gluconokinase [Pseudonocardiaceae bacterium]|nr:gluconokinase [Pseudonocardiaceae bacterium]
MADPVVLGVDLGTTATKVVAAGVDGTLHALAECQYPLTTGPHGEATQDADQVLAAARQALAESAKACDGRRIAGISFSAAMHTLLPLDGGGRPLGPALSWADHRAAGVARALRADGDRAAALHRATGTPVHPMSPLVKLAWFAEHDPDLHAAAKHWVGVKDYVLARLTGRLATEHSCASGTGLMDIHTLSWHQPSLDLARITADQLPELLAPTDTLPLAEAEGDLPAGLPVVAGGGDGPLANLGTGATRPGTAALSLGTSGALRAVRESPGVDERGRLFCYALADGLWVAGGAVSNGGVVAAWASDTFGVPVHDLLAEADAADPAGLLALPYLLGERAPWCDPDPRAVLLGLRREHGRAEITRAMIEGVGQQLALVAESLDGLTEIRVTGGAFRSAVWGRVVSAALDRDLAVTADEGGSGLGAALLGWRGLGELDSLAGVADLITPTDTIHPEPELARRLADSRALVTGAHDALVSLLAQR